MIFWMSVTAIGSMPANGSSRSMNFGAITSARVISARRRSPPHSVAAGGPRRPRQRRQVEFRQQFAQAGSAGLAIEPHGLEDGQHVLLDGQAAEDRRLLG